MREPRRLRAQPAKPARGRRARGALPGVRRPEPQLRDARRHPEALLAAQRPAAGRSRARAPCGQRFLHGTQPRLEAQLVNLADEMAYNAHDIDDGVRSGLITLGAAAATCRCSPHWHDAGAGRPPGAGRHAAARRLLFEIMRRMLSAHGRRPRRATPRAAIAAPRAGRRRRGAPAAAAGGLQRADAPSLQRTEAASCSARCTAMRRSLQSTERWPRQVVAELFAAYVAQPAEMPADYAGSRRPRARRGRLHRRHDRPLRGARAPAPDRAVACSANCLRHRRQRIAWPACRAWPWCPASRTTSCSAATTASRCSPTTTTAACSWRCWAKRRRRSGCRCMRYALLPTRSAPAGHADAAPIR